MNLQREINRRTNFDLLVIGGFVAFVLIVLMVISKDKTDEAQDETDKRLVEIGHEVDLLSKDADHLDTKVRLWSYQVDALSEKVSRMETAEAGQAQP